MSAMRWPSWRGRRATAPAGEPTAGQSTVDTAPAGAGPAPDAAAVHPAASRPAWRSATPLRPTVDLRPPALLLPGLPEVSGTRPLLHRHEPAARAVEVTVPMGRVTGLATAVTPVPDGPAEPPRPALAYAPPPRALPAQQRRPRPELVHATDDYVGEPRVPAEPHRAPGWLRALSQAAPVEAIPGLPAALAAMPITPSPRPEASRSVAPAALPAALGRFAPPRRAGLGPPIVPPAMMATPEGPSGPGFPPTGVPGRVAGRSGTVRARARGGLGPPLVSAPPDLPRPGQPSAREPAPHPPAPEEPEPAVAVPTELIQALRSAYGAEIGDVPVRSGPAARDEARAREARAYAADNEVVLGAEPGDPTVRRALIAHELVHLVQQRDLGSALPDESSPAGRALEADAVAAEHAVLTGRPLPPLRHRALGGPPPGKVRALAGRVQRAPLTHPDTTTPSTGTGPAGDPATTSPSTPTAPGTPTASGTPTTPTAPTTPSASTGSGTPTNPGGATGTGTDTTTTTTQPAGWAGFGQLVGNSMEAITLAEWGIADDTTDAGGGGGGGGGRRSTPGGRRSGAQSTVDDDPWRLRQTTRARFERLGEVVSHDLGGIMAAPWGIDIDQVQQQQSGTVTGSGTGSGSGSAAGSTAGTAGTHTTGTPAADGHGGATQPDGHHGHGGMGPAVHTDPSRPLSPTGRPQIDTDDLDLDELAGRLYDRLRSRLRMELLLDRERAGLLTDFR